MNTTQIIAYTIINAESLPQLERYVNAAILKGWQPLGGVSVSEVHNLVGGVETIRVQALVKYEQKFSIP